MSHVKGDHVDAARLGDHGESPTSRGVATHGSGNVDINSKAALRVCDAGTGETGDCQGMVWEPVMGSGTVEVNGRPLVRKGDLTQHFKCGPGKMIEGSRNVEVGGAGVLPKQASLDALVQYIYNQMMKNKDDPRVKQILKDNQSLYAKLSAYEQFKELVGYTQPFDQKQDIRDNYGRWAYDAGTDTSIEYETWSNIHYGFVGEAAGFGQKELLDGAGLAQWLHDNPKASELAKATKYAEFAMGNTAQYDQADDQQAIKIGSELWKKYRATGQITQQDVKDAVLKARANLTSASGPVC